MTTIYSESEDGYIRGFGSTYALARAGNSRGVLDTGTSMKAGQAKESGEFNVYRGGLFFNTSGLSGFVTSASLWLRKTSSSLNDDQDLRIVSGEDLESTGLNVGDFTQLGGRTTSLGSISKADWEAAAGGADGYAEISLNAAGIAAINVGGITKLGLRGTHDINNTPDAGFIERNYFQFYTNEMNPGDEITPKLIVDAGGTVYPTEAISRVSSIIHRYDRGIYNMVIGFGDVLSDYGIPFITTATRKSYEPTPEEPSPPPDIPPTLPPWVPAPVCLRGMTRCFGDDLYKCVNGRWELLEANSASCGGAGAECVEGTSKYADGIWYLCINGKWERQQGL